MRRRGGSQWGLGPAGAGGTVVAPCGGDCAALLGPRAHGRTRYAACGRCAQTSGR